MGIGQCLVYIYESQMIYAFKVHSLLKTYCRSDICKSLFAPELNVKCENVVFLYAFCALSNLHLIFSIIKNNTAQPMPYVIVYDI